MYIDLCTKPCGIYSSWLQGLGYVIELLFYLLHVHLIYTWTILYIICTMKCGPNIAEFSRASLSKLSTGKLPSLMYTSVQAKWMSPAMHANSHIWSRQLQQWVWCRKLVVDLRSAPQHSKQKHSWIVKKNKVCMTSDSTFYYTSWFCSLFF